MVEKSFRCFTCFILPSWNLLKPSEIFSTSIWHSLFPSCESFGQVCTRNIGDGHRFRPKSSGQKRQALFPSCESYGQVCSVIQSRISRTPFRTCTYTQVVSKRYAEYIWLIYFCGEYYDEDIINIRTSDSVTDMKEREKLILLTTSLTNNYPQNLSLV